MTKARDNIDIDCSKHSSYYTRLLRKYFGMTLFKIDISKK